MIGRLRDKGANIKYLEKECDKFNQNMLEHIVLGSPFDSTRLSRWLRDEDSDKEQGVRVEGNNKWNLEWLTAAAKNVPNIQKWRGGWNDVIQISCHRDSAIL